MNREPPASEEFREDETTWIGAGLQVDIEHHVRTVLAAAIDGFALGVTYDGTKPVYLLTYQVYAPEPAVETTLIAAEAPSDIQQQLNKIIGERYDRVHPNEIVSYAKLEVGDDGGIASVEYGTDPMKQDSM